MTRSFQTLLFVALVYAAVAAGVTAVWVYCARTENGVELLDVRLPSGEQCSARFCSVVRLVEGKAYAPFVRRRLLPDLARGLAAAIPEGAWPPLRRLLDPATAPTWMAGTLARQQWRPEHAPVLFSSYFLIGASVLGFMLACRWLVTLLYHTPARVADLAGLALGAALLGGNGDWHYCGYPYDFPTAFAFALALAALLARAWWFPLAFAVAAYSKETAVLLIAAQVLIAPRWRSPRFWGLLALLGVEFVAIRGWLQWRYPNPQPDGGFWFPLRNAKYFTFPVFYSWSMPFFAIGAARLLALRARFPAALKRLCLLALPLLGMAFFKGWLEELRQYLELLPVFGLLLFHWCLHEAGLGHLLTAREPVAVAFRPVPIARGASGGACAPKSSHAGAA